MFARAFVGALFTGAIGLVLSGVVAAQDDAKGQPYDPQQIARGAQAWKENCARCHNYRDPQELEDYEWDMVVNHMRIRANIPGQDAEDIKAFLKSSN